MKQNRKLKKYMANDPGESFAFTKYAAYYDILYQDKDYIGEAQFVSRLIQQELDVPQDKICILDLACGTGRHAIELSRLGYSIEGSDISKEMIRVAARESKKKGFVINYHNESFQTAGNIKKKYNVIVSMFSAINYLTTYDDLTKALKNIYELLEDDGIFIFDFWNGNAVLENYSPVRVKRMSQNNMEVLRISETSLDPISQIATVCFNFMLIKNRYIEKEFQEKHFIRYFFLQELTDLLKANKFKIAFQCPFLDETSNLSMHDWNVTFVVRKAE